MVSRQSRYWDGWGGDCRRLNEAPNQAMPGDAQMDGTTEQILTYANVCDIFILV